MTKGKFVSSILTETKDTRISRRTILSIAESYANTYMAQRLDSMKLESDFSLTTPLKCFKLEKIDAIRCGYVELKTCKSIMRSVKKLPKTITSKNGYAIFMVTAIDGEAEFKYISRQKYNLRKDRKFKRDSNSYYLIEDDYLILLDETTELVDVYMIALDEEEIEEKSECSDCKNTKESAKCKSLWDEKFVCPEKLLANVRSATIQEIMGKNRIPKDENPNLDSNERGATVGKA